MGLVPHAVADWLATLPIEERGRLTSEAASLLYINASNAAIHRMLSESGYTGTTASVMHWSKGLTPIQFASGNQVIESEKKLKAEYGNADPLISLEMALVETRNKIKKIYEWLKTNEEIDTDRATKYLTALPALLRENRAAASAIADMKAKLAAEDVRRALLQEIRELAGKKAREMAQPQVIALVEPLLKVIEENHAERAA